MNATIVKMANFIKEKPKSAAWLCDKLQIELYQLLLILDGIGSDYFTYQIDLKNPYKSTVALSERGEKLIYKAPAIKKWAIALGTVAVALWAYHTLTKNKDPFSDIAEE
jgi:hypothetical protein